jgi:hypothetical protein
VTRALVAFGLAISVASVAEAQRSPLRAVERAYEAGELERALDGLDRAEARDDLSREDVVAAFTFRLLIAHALDDDAALERAALALVSLEPEGPSRSVSPPIAAALERARERVGGRIEVTVRRGEGGVARVLVAHDVAGIVRRVDVHARRDDGEWLEGEEANALLAEGGPGLDVYARVIGPGGAALVELGSETEPVALDGLELDAPTPTPAPEVEPEDDDTLLYVALIAGGTVLTGLLVMTIALVAGGGSPRIGAIDIAW